MSPLFSDSTEDKIDMLDKNRRQNSQSVDVSTSSFATFKKPGVPRFKATKKKKKGIKKESL